MRQLHWTTSNTRMNAPASAAFSTPGFRLAAFPMTTQYHFTGLKVRGVELTLLTQCTHCEPGYLFTMGQ